MDEFDDLLKAIFGTIALIVLAIVYIVALVYEAITDWFQNYEKSHNMDASEVGFTILQALNDPDTPRVPGVFTRKNANAQYATIQGIFNQDTQKVTAARKAESKTVDSKLAAAHRSKPVVLYE